MKLAIMQPYFLPYIGYFQLIQAVDLFVLYDDIKYTKKGWINRNRMLLNSADTVFSLPLRKGSDSLDVAQRELAADFDCRKLLNQFKGAYARAPFFAQTFTLLERIVCNSERNLFRFIRQSLDILCAHLGIATEVRASSEYAIDRSLTARHRVLSLCHAAGASVYINAIGGLELYDRTEFLAQGVELKFIRAKPLEYRQFSRNFVPWLSMIDVMMFNAPAQVRALIEEGYELV